MKAAVPVVFAVAVGVAGTWLASDVDPQPLTLPPLRKLPDLTDPTSTRLVVERLFEHEPGFKGPESFAFLEDGSFYTGLADGRIVHVFPDTPRRTVDVAQTGTRVPGCGQLDHEHTCGRPLGLRLEGNGSLLVADAYLGLLRVDPRTGARDVLVSLAAANMTLMNDLDFDADKRVVFFTNTGRFPRREIHKSLIEATPSGSVLAFHLDTGKIEVVASGLVMPNGITLTHDKQALLVCSTVLSGLYRIDLADDARGVKLVQNDLQGTPDNIRRHRPPTDGKPGTYLVALGSKRALPFSLPQLLAPFQAVRRIFGVLDLTTTTSLIPRAGLVVEVDDNGKQTHFFQDPDKHAYWISEAEEHGGFMYLGSWATSFLARAKVPPAQ